MSTSTAGLFLLLGRILNTNRMIDIDSIRTIARVAIDSLEVALVDPVSFTASIGFNPQYS